MSPDHSIFREPRRLREQSGDSNESAGLIIAGEEIVQPNSLRSQRLVRVCLLLASPVATIAMLIGLVVLAGYATGVQFFWSVTDGAPAARPIVAMGIFMAGLAVLLARPRRMGNISLVLATLVGVIGVFGLAHSRFAWTLWFFPRAASTPGAGRVAPDTAVTLLLLALAIALLRFHKVAAAQCAAASAAFVPYTASVAYLYHIPGFAGWMAFPVMVGSFAAAIAILLRTAHSDPLRAFLSPERAGRMARYQMMILCGCSIGIGSIAVFSNPVSARPALAFESAVIGLVTLLVIAASSIHYERIDRGRRRADSELLSAATHDHLTGLLNRRGFFIVGSEILHRQKLKGEGAGILLLDIDHYKAINDSYGHQAGDAYLQQLAAEIARSGGAADVCGRLVSNQFAVILPGADAGAARAAAEKLRGAIENVVADGLGQIRSVTASVGISTTELGGFRLEELLSQADLALFLAKSEGRNRSKIFQTEDAQRTAENKELEQALRHALERNEIFAVYQPQVNLMSDRLVGAEALARWRHPTRGLIPPDKFIPLAEASGQIGAIGAWVLDNACRQIGLWKQAGLTDLLISVNVSPAQLRQPEFAALVKQTLGSHGLLPKDLILEVTESLMMQSGEVGHQELHELVDMGVRIAIDDFGTGYSSLSYLHMLPCDFLKIDRSFVKNIPNNKDAVSIAKSVVAMGRNLGLHLIAEGIETAQQAEFLKGLWCEDGQGYLFGAPMNGDDFEQWAKSRGHQKPDAESGGMRETA